jgi:transposase
MAEGKDAKFQFLKSRNALHPHPQRVRDPLFAGSEFFDPRDLVQVRYEMLRRHRIEGRAVAQVARAFGVSRQLFYLLERAFLSQGIYGLLPRKRGPKHARKCSLKVVQFLAERRGQQPPTPWDELAAEVQDRFGVHLHPRTLQRAWRGQKGGRRRRTNSRPGRRKQTATRRRNTSIFGARR